MSGTSVATPIAAGLAASVLCFVDQQDQHVEASKRLRTWLKEYSSMEKVFLSMAAKRGKYNYIRPHVLFSSNSTPDSVYGDIWKLKRNMYQ